MRRDAHVVGGLAHVARADIEVELLVDGVVGQQRRLHQVHAPAVGAVVGLHLDRAEAGVQVERLGHVVGPARVDLVGRDRRQQHDRLERRARLAVALRRVVELLPVVVLAGGHRDDVAVAGVDRDDRRRGIVPLIQAPADGLAGLTLEAHVQRRVDAQPATVDDGVAQVAAQLALDVVEEVPLAPVRVEVAQVQAEAARVDLVGDGLLDHPGAHHRRKHLRAAVLRRIRVAHRAVERRRLRQPRQERRFGQVQIARRPPEVHARRGVDADRLLPPDRPEADVVQVARQDPVLRVALLHLARERGLLDLALERALRVQVERPDQLHRDRRAALDDRVRGDVLRRGTQDRGVVDAAVLVEAPVLDRDHRLLHRRRDVGRRHGLAQLDRRDEAQPLAVGGVDDRVRRPRPRVQRVDRRRLRAQIEDVADERRSSDDDDAQRDADGPEQDPPDPPEHDLIVPSS